jgi:hypothetical protein
MSGEVARAPNSHPEANRKRIMKGAPLQSAGPVCDL